MPDISRYLENRQGEIDSAGQYRALARQEHNPKLAQVFLNLAEVEEVHVRFWEDQIRKAGAVVPPRNLSWRGKALIFLTRYLGPSLVLPTIAAAERADRNLYAMEPESAQTAMAGEERTHSRVLQQVLRTQRGGLEGSVLGRLEGRHRAVGGNALRAAVLGANDGLCSNLSLVMGVVGASVENRAVLLTGIAGLLAGAFSMALGEWVSVRSAQELAEREIRIEGEELAADPESERKELQLIFEAKGLRPEEAKSMTTRFFSDHGVALDTLAREELGINPEDLGGSPWEAAGVSFALFAVGAVIPVLPFLIGHGRAPVAISLLVSALALFGIGVLISLFTGRPAIMSGTRQLALGLAAAAITFAIGKAIGVAVS